MKKFVLLLFILACCFQAAAQVSINGDNSSPDPTAMLDVKSTTKGLLPPRMTLEQVSLISNPANGLIVFCTTDNKLYIYLANFAQWKEISVGTSSIQPQVVCGSTFTINHLAGEVAPEPKTTTYGTITNIAGEPLKCWITSNLGATRQAIAVDDASEPSAGWYWQFNRKQGYKHDGTTRTPASAWTTVINESLDWLAENDPCTLELSAGWRIPTHTELINIDASGGWTTWNDPWNSNLKLHAAGYLNNGNGSLLSRGSSGFTVSSVQNNVTNAYYLYFGNISSVVGYLPKTCGFTIRCVRG
ncbi:MAG: hypothetical protein NT040_00425 [Bacteroidetes bacterium]|nr:hypothetical protein [Bacteroidota bacterium]